MSYQWRLHSSAKLSLHLWPLTSLKWIFSFLSWRRSMYIIAVSKNWWALVTSICVNQLVNNSQYLREKYLSGYYHTHYLYSLLLKCLEVKTVEQWRIFCLHVMSHLTRYLYSLCVRIYIYIYVCVCVCVCVLQYVIFNTDLHMVWCVITHYV